MTVERLHVRTIWISAVVSALAAAPIGWLAASFEIGRMVTIHTEQIAIIEKDTELLKAANNSRVTREEFTHMQQEQAGHWMEQHDFFKRQDQRTDEIIRDHARIFAMFQNRKGFKEGDQLK